MPYPLPKDALEFALDLRPVVEDELAALEHDLGRGFPEKHRARYDLQAASKALYLIAWIGTTPVGHVLVEWDGTSDEPMASYLGACPVISDLFVVEELRSRGVGSELLADVERRARERGHERVALGVAVDNPRARALYERNNYADAGLGTYISHWQGPDKDGRLSWFEEWENCLVKSLPPLE